MAKMFYSAGEAAQKLGKTEEELKILVRNGELREFRDAGSVNYKVGDVDAMMPSLALDGSSGSGAMGGSALGGSAASASASGDIMLEPIEGSSIEFSPAGSDIIDLADSDAAGGTASGTSSGTTAAHKAKGDTVVPSVGVNVFDDDELDDQVDPLAQTAVTDVAGLGMEGIGSGSGILDLTRESDDTSLGKELLDEIYTDDDKDKDDATLEMGEDTRAGLDEAIPEKTTADEDDESVETAGTADATKPTRVARQVVVYGPDAASMAVTAMMIVAVVVMWFAGLGAAALVRGITPSLLESIYANLWMFAAGALVAAVAAGAVTYLVAKKRAG